ncbi:MAG: cellulase family glycosylhydrolase, partial [Planctomycetota bacterium]
MDRALLAAGLVLAFAAATAAGEGKLFPFVISYDAPDNLTNVADWLDRPAGQHGFVRANDSHFATDAGRIRFWATNFCFEACFPEKDTAEKVAARLARFGINCVRLHHMDHHSIWGDSPNKTVIDPDKLDRLDYLVAQLKARGIYVNINLHVSRFLGPKEGFPHRDGRPRYDKGLDNFEPRMIELQRKYARDLLTHVNPYTEKPYTDEPAVAFVEISNEDALFAVWNWGQLDDLPEPYATTFREQWNTFLREKYQTTEALARAWNVGRRELGDELLANGDFTKPLDGTWVLERDGRCKASWSVEKGGPGGRPYLRVVVERMGERSWIPQFQHAGFAVRKGEPYTLTFRIRADKQRRISFNCMMAHEPWQRLGLSSSCAIGPQWREHKAVFVATRDDPEARITFSNLEAGATYELAHVSLRPGGIIGLQPGQRLEDNSVPIVRHGQMNVTETARRDWVDFLYQTERDYWLGMYRFLKDDLGVKSLVAGTQLSYSPVHIQAALDYIDAHSYWNHPSFPGRPWDPGNWFVRNRALVNHPPGTLGGLAARRVYAKPFTCSEYNHPAPNAYAAEG